MKLSQHRRQEFDISLQYSQTKGRGQSRQLVTESLDPSKAGRGKPAVMNRKWTQVSGPPAGLQLWGEKRAKARLYLQFFF